MIELYVYRVMERVRGVLPPLKFAATLTFTIFLGGVKCLPRHFHSIKLFRSTGYAIHVPAAPPMWAAAYNLSTGSRRETFPSCPNAPPLT